MITFGAESVKFFYQPYDFVTGNKMYYFTHENLTEESGLFIQLMAQTSVIDSGFGYGMGLTGSRFSSRNVKLPKTVDSNGDIIPDWDYMTNYISSIMNRYKLPSIDETTVSTKKLNDVKWAPIKVGDIFDVKRGKSGAKNKLSEGNIPLISARKVNNGLDSYIDMPVILTNNGNVLTINNNGDGGAGLAYYQKFNFTATQDVSILAPKPHVTFNENIGLFLSTIMSKMHEVFSFGNKLSANRILNYRIMLPVITDSLGNVLLDRIGLPIPDWDFMNDYIASVPNAQLIIGGIL